MASTFKWREAHESLEKEDKNGEVTHPRKSLDVTPTSIAINVRMFILAFISNDQIIKTVIIFA